MHAVPHNILTQVQILYVCLCPAVAMPTTGHAYYFRIYAYIIK